MKMRTEEEINAEIRKLYAERMKIRKQSYGEFVGKCYIINGSYMCISKILDSAISVLTIDDEHIGLVEIKTDPNQWKEYEISKEEFVKQLNLRSKSFIKLIGGTE